MVFVVHGWATLVLFMDSLSQPSRSSVRSANTECLPYCSVS